MMPEIRVAILKKQFETLKKKCIGQYQYFYIKTLIEDFKISDLVKISQQILIEIELAKIQAEIDVLEPLIGQTLDV